MPPKKKDAVISEAKTENSVTPNWMLKATRTAEWTQGQDLEASEIDVIKYGTSKRGFNSMTVFHKASSKTLTLNMNEILGECEARYSALLDLVFTKNGERYTWLGKAKIGFNAGMVFFEPLTA
jgi:hypothetical protein